MWVPAQSRCVNAHRAIRVLSDDFGRTVPDQMTSDRYCRRLVILQIVIHLTHKAAYKEFFCLLLLIQIHVSRKNTNSSHMVCK